jgi:hypothetical protein
MPDKNPIKVRALVSFSGIEAGIPFQVAAGDEVTMPAGADWVDAGLCERVPEPEESAVLPPPERAVSRGRKK